MSLPKDTVATTPTDHNSKNFDGSTKIFPRLKLLVGTFSTLFRSSQPKGEGDIDLLHYLHETLSIQTLSPRLPQNDEYRRRKRTSRPPHYPFVQPSFYPSVTLLSSLKRREKVPLPPSCGFSTTWFPTRPSRLFRLQTLLLKYLRRERRRIHLSPVGYYTPLHSKDHF